MDVKEISEVRKIVVQHFQSFFYSLQITTLKDNFSKQVNGDVLGLALFMIMMPVKCLL